MMTSSLVLRHPRTIAYYKAALNRALRMAEGERELQAKRNWQAIAGHCALRICEIEEA
jgi:hypothetical protein